MAKSQDAFRTIGEVADWLGAPTHVLRFWESRFTQIRPIKGDGGARFYRPSDMALLGGIKKLLQEDGLTIGGVQALLRERGVPHVAAQSPPVDSGARKANGARVADRDGEAESEERESKPDDGARDVLVLERAALDNAASRPLDPASRRANGPGDVADAESERADGAEPEPGGDASNVLVLGREAPDIDASQPSLPFDAAASARNGSVCAPSGESSQESGEDESSGAAPSLEPDSLASGPGDDGSCDDGEPPEPGDEGSRDGGESPEPAVVSPAPEEATNGTSLAAGGRERSALAAEVLALLRQGGRAEPEELRPLYGQLRKLRERMAPDRTGS